jgi:hypothetical protein
MGPADTGRLRPSYSGSACPPPTPPSLAAHLHSGGSESSGSAGSYPASCSPQLPFAFTPSGLSLSSLHDHSVRVRSMWRVKPLLHSLQ